MNYHDYVDITSFLKTLGYKVVEVESDEEVWIKNEHKIKIELPLPKGVL